MSGQAQIAYFRERPTGPITDKTFEVVSEPMPTPKDGELLIATEYLSLDPAMRTWLDEGNKDGSNYMPPIQINAMMTGYGIGKVIESKAEGFKAGDRILGGVNWRSHAVIPANEVYWKLPENVESTTALSSLGITGLTAYFGVTEVGRVDLSKPEANKGKVAVVSGAAGATGSVAVQLYKAAGFTVIGVAGSDEKCRWVESLGADRCLNYKAGPQAYRAELEKLAPKRVTQYFDNTGGWILDETMDWMAMYSCIVGCGMISQYNTEDHRFAYKMFPLVSHRIRFEGFIVSDYWAKFAEAREVLGKMLADGKLKTEVTVVEGGIPAAPAALRELYNGSNTGKLVVKCL